MMMLAMLALAGTTIPVAEAERAFAAQAQREGQWTAFRATATDDAVMFVPERVNAQEWLKGRADPGKAVAWAPKTAVASCDGSMAVTTGPYREAEGVTGRFSTVWRRQADGGWKWVLDQGVPAAAATDPARVKTKAIKPDCGNLALAKERKWGPVEVLLFMGTPGPVRPLGNPLEQLTGGAFPLLAYGASDDATLIWAIRGNQTGQRRLRAWVWNGRSIDPAISQDTP